MEINDTEIEVSAENVIGPDLDIGVTQGIIQDIGTVETKVGTEDKDLELFQEMGKIDMKV